MMAQDTDNASTRREPEWVESMHAHFRRTGAYRASDIRRVLGDPLKSVQINARTDLKLAAKAE
jgi:hypothetical protein